MLRSVFAIRKLRTNERVLRTCLTVVQPCTIHQFPPCESLSIHPTWYKTQVPTDLTTGFNPWYNMVMATTFEMIVMVWGIGLMVFGCYKALTYTP